MRRLLLLVLFAALVVPPSEAFAARAQPLRVELAHQARDGKRPPSVRGRQGWRNDHTDWLWRDVRVFRKRLRRIT